VAWQDNVPPAFHKTVYLARSSDEGRVLCDKPTNNVGKLDPSIYESEDASGGIIWCGWIGRRAMRASSHTFNGRRSDVCSGADLSHDVVIVDGSLGG